MYGDAASSDASEWNEIIESQNIFIVFMVVINKTNGFLYVPKCKYGWCNKYSATFLSYTLSHCPGWAGMESMAFFRKIFGPEKFQVHRCRCSGAGARTNRISARLVLQVHTSSTRSVIRWMYDYDRKVVELSHFGAFEKVEFSSTMVKVWLWRKSSRIETFWEVSERGSISFIFIFW